MTTLEYKTSDLSPAKSLYQAARDARASKDYLKAESLYKSLSKTFPEDWEAKFYSSQCNAMSGNGFKPAATKFVAELLTNTLLLVLLKKECREDIAEESEEKIIPQLELDIEDATKTSYYRVTKELNSFLSQGQTPQLLNEYLQGIFSISFVPAAMGTDIHLFYKDKFLSHALKSWKLSVQLTVDSLNTYSQHLNDEYFNNQKKQAEDTIAKIRREEPDYVPPTIEAKKTPKSEGCYIATAVYGTYDSPELWTLRRFRDEILRKTSLGTYFVKVYYHVSPTLVHYLGGYNLTKKCIRPFLDRFVRQLNQKGISSEAYKDI